VTQPVAPFRRYEGLQRCVGWTEDDSQNVRAVAGLLDPHLGPLVDDFYAKIEKHPAAADTGVGISADRLGRILEPLYTTKARGLGLGLALARAILEKNKGSLRAASVLGQGTTFTVSLTSVVE